MLEALGNRVIVFPDPVETQVGSIFIVRDERQAKAETSSGTIIDIGPSAWLDPLLGGEPWCEVGDRVVYSKYSGKFVTDPDDEKEYVVINDDAVQARIEKCQK